MTSTSNGKQNKWTIRLFYNRIGFRYRKKGHFIILSRSWIIHTNGTLEVDGWTGEWFAVFVWTKDRTSVAHFFTHTWQNIDVQWKFIESYVLLSLTQKHTHILIINNPSNNCTWLVISYVVEINIQDSWKVENICHFESL